MLQSGNYIFDEMAHLVELGIELWIRFRAVRFSRNNYGYLAGLYKVEILGKSDFRVNWQDDVNFVLQEIFRMTAPAL